MWSPSLTDGSVRLQISPRWSQAECSTLTFQTAKLSPREDVTGQRASSKSIPEPVSGRLKVPSSPENLEKPSAGYRAFYLEEIFELGFEGKVGIPR